MQIDEKFKKELNEMVQRSPELLESYRAGLKSKNKSEFIRLYQSWYTLASRIVNLLAPDRADEFDAYYKKEEEKTPESRYTHKGEQFKDEGSYTIMDYILGMQAKKYTGYAGGEVWNPGMLVEIKLTNQIEILNAIHYQLEQAIFNVSAELQMQIQDRELEAAKQLLAIDPRAAGLVVNSILDNHVDRVLENRNISLDEEEAELGDKISLLKREGLLEPIQWRKIQFLVETGKLCAQNSEKEPDKETVEEMIEGVDKVLKMIF